MSITIPPTPSDCIAAKLSDKTPTARLLYLRLLEAHERGDPPLAQRELRDRMEVGDTTTREQLNALEDAGVIARCNDSRDARCVYYEVTWTPE